MRRPLLLLSPLLVFCCATLRAQEPPPGASSRPAAVESPAPTMSPRQVEEMRSDILMARKMYREAISGYAKLLRGEPRNAVLLNKMGIGYQQEGNLGRASHYYKRAMKFDKTYASAVNNLGTLEYARRKYGKAIRLYQKTLKLRGDMSTVYSNLGYAYFAKKKYAEAMDAFARALALDPDIFERRGNYGTVIQERSMADPGLFYFLVAKTYALAGDAEHCAQYLKIARDDGYKGFASAEKDPAFSRVIKDPRVQQVIQVPPAFAVAPRKAALP